MKQSVFNHTVTMSNGGCILFNFYNGHAILLNLLNRDYYDNFELYDPAHPMIMKLRKKGFLVDFDEIAQLKKLVSDDQNGNGEVVLTICPTLRCNFTCPYCFETPRNGRMSEEVQKDVVSFVDRLLSTGRVKVLNIMWYGGEPLLECEIIRSLSERFISICEKKEVKYRAGIITNGYFLTPEKSALFEDCRIRYAQITLDGPTAKVHDATRHLAGGQGTFERIIENIRRFKGRTNLRIRCNVHKENAKLYPKLQEMILDIANETGQEISVYPGHMDGHGEYEDKTVSISEYADIYKQNKSAIGLLHYKGLRCTYSKKLDFIIDEQGNLSKCLESVNCGSEIVGNVRDFEFNDDLSNENDEMKACEKMAWPEDEECLSCKLLPVCLGGCPRKRRYSKKQCSGYKFALDDYVTAVGEEIISHGKK